MNKITIISEENNDETIITRTSEEYMDIYFLGKSFYEFLKGNGFEEREINKILKTEELEY